VAGAEVVDYGCGSGILAIAALKRGAYHAWGVDIDPDARTISRENAARNGVAKKFSGAQAGALPPGLHADIVMANILAPPLMELAPLFTRLVKKGGHLLLAGLLIEQIEQVAAYYARDFALGARVRDGWALIMGNKT
jgi:ribosomal protein L11 methyltransferase